MKFKSAADKLNYYLTQSKAAEQEVANEKALEANLDKIKKYVAGLKIDWDLFIKSEYRRIKPAVQRVRFTKDQVKEIKEALAKGSKPADLATKYGVTEKRISKLA